MYRYAIVPDSAWFLAMPNGNVGAAMRDLSRAYVFGPERQVRRGSYSMSYYTMTLRRD